MSDWDNLDTFQFAQPLEEEDKIDYYPEPELPPIEDSKEEAASNKQFPFATIESCKQYAKSKKYSGYVLLPAKWLPKVRIDNRRFHDFGQIIYFPQ